MSRSTRPPARAVDENYRLRPQARAFLRRRRRLHAFDLLAPIPSCTLGDSAWLREPGPCGSERLWLRLRRPRRLAAGEVLALPALPPDAGGLVGARACAEGAARVIVQGEPLPGAPPQRWRLKLPLVGRPLLRVGRSGARLSQVELWAYHPRAFEDLDRYPVHLPVRVGEELELPLAPWRTARRVEQIAIHWGSVAYRWPERRLPLGAWGYPYYLDGVLGDVFAQRDGRWRCLARGKFLEFDELENIRGFDPQRADRIRVRLRSRDGEVPPAPCRIAALEVRYAPAAGAAPLRVEVGRDASRGRPLRLALPRRGALARLDLAWRDRGPAMGALQIGTARSRWSNVCSGERRSFSYLYGGRADVALVHAELAPLTVEEALLYLRGDGEDR